jgi:hypothetical protein
MKINQHFTAGLKKEVEHDDKTNKRNFKNFWQLKHYYIRFLLQKTFVYKQTVMTGAQIYMY